MTPPWATITPSAPPSGTSTSAVSENDVFFIISTRVLGQPAHAAEQQLALALDQRRAAGRLGQAALDEAVVERDDVVLDRLDQPQPLQLVQLLRCSAARSWPASSPSSCRRAPRRRRRTPAAWRRRRSPTACGAWSPRSSPCGRCRGCRTSRSTASRGARPRRASSNEYAMLTPSIGFCCDAVDERRLRQAGDLEHVGATSITWWNWLRISPLASMPLRPVDDRAVAGAAEVRGDLLGPLVRRVHRVRPADRVVVVGLRPAELVDLATT